MREPITTIEMTTIWRMKAQAGLYMLLTDEMMRDGSDGCTLGNRAGGPSHPITPPETRERKKVK